MSSFRIDGELRLKELPPEKQGAVSSIKITKNGTEVKLHDKLKALEFLAKYTGLTDRKTTTVTQNNLLEMLAACREGVNFDSIPELNGEWQP